MPSCIQNNNRCLFNNGCLNGLDFEKFGIHDVTRDIYGDYARGVVGRVSEPGILVWRVKRHGFDARSLPDIFIGAGYPALHQFALLSVRPMHKLMLPTEYSKTIVRTLKNIQGFK